MGKNAKKTQKRNVTKKGDDVEEEDILPPVCSHALDINPDWVEALDLEELELKCELCEAQSEPPTKESGKGGKQKHGGKAQTRKGGKGYKSGGKGHEPEMAADGGTDTGDLMVCLSCGKILCERKHAPEHASKRKSQETKKGKRGGTEDHQLALYSSTLLDKAFKCYCYTHKIAMATQSGGDEEPFDDEDFDPGVIERQAKLSETCEALCCKACSSPSFNASIHALRRNLKDRGTASSSFESGQRHSKAERGKKFRRGRQGNGHHEHHGASSLPAAAVQAGMKGLANMGNTCFFNSVLQVLNQTSPLIDHFVVNRSKDSVAGEISVAMCVAMAKMREAGKMHYRPDTLFRAVVSKAPHFHGWGQQDAQELLRFLLDGMHWEYHTKAKWQAETVLNIVSDAFEGTLSSTIVCHACQRASRRLEPFFDLSLAVSGEGMKVAPSVAFGTEGDRHFLPAETVREWIRENRQHSLSFSLGAFFSPELLEGSNGYLCENCCKEAWLAEQRRQLEEDRAKEERMREMMERAIPAPSLEAAMAQDDAAQSDSEEEEEEDEEEEEEGEEKEENNDEEKDAPKQVDSEPMDATVVVAAVPQQPAEVTLAPSPEPVKSGSIRTLTTATKQCAITKLPTILTLHLKRFAFTGKGWKKDSSPVSFPLELEIGAFVHPTAPGIAPSPAVTRVTAQLAEMGIEAPTEHVEAALKATKNNTERAIMYILDSPPPKSVPVVPQASSDKRSQKYRLFGAVVHQGSLNSGHYTCYVQPVDTAKDTRSSQWFYCSDWEVHPVAEHEVLRSEPYILFYERCK
eukprot:TRINITY_DN9936_c0_g1_i1.p1 TRINITY_DN9936_c0_g1~~TRINITY_DN9936_c0_g1_i1.p1  ORF type:complete len:814 (-),score=148.88 TRINITY_DN9936_c0_g1_i1:28-2430(-)